LHNFFYRTHGRFPFAAKHRGGNIIPQSFDLYNRRVNITLTICQSVRVRSSDGRSHSSGDGKSHDNRSGVSRKKAADFVDKSLLADLDREGFFDKLASKYGKQS
jgi:hypothetical protein